MVSDAVHGRDPLLHQAERLIAATRASHGGGLAVLGGPGTGRTTILDAIARRATGFQICAVSGVAPERALPGAGLHRLSQSVPGTDLTVHSRPNLAFFAALHRMFVTLARSGPVLARVDDTHWLDPASLAGLTFVARRVSTERVAMVFAGTDTSDALAGIPAVRLDPLDDDAGRLVLAGRLPAWLAPDVADDLVELASGNPLALALTGAVTDPRGRTPAGSVA